MTNEVELKRRFPRLASSLPMILAFLCCHRPEAREADRFSVEQTPTDRPFIIIHRYPAYTSPNNQFNAGVIAAVWKDGRMIRIESEDTIGRKYVQGRLLPDQITTTIRFLVDGHLIEDAEDLILADAASESVYVRLPDRIVERTESLPRSSDSLIGNLRSFLLAAPITNSRSLNGKWELLPAEWGQ